MFMRHERSHTKVIATIGPATRNKEILKKMFIEGLDVCRINCSHDLHSEHLKTIKFVRELNEEMGTHVAILADLQGPKLRVGNMENGPCLEKLWEVTLCPAISTAFLMWPPMKPDDPVMNTFTTSPLAVFGHKISTRNILLSKQFCRW